MLLKVIRFLRSHFLYKETGKWLLPFLVVLFSVSFSYGQTFVFAQLQGAPANTTGWNLGGFARVGNIISSDNSEIILCDAHTTETGSVFYNQPINLAKCNKWKAEFDFRMFDGTAADGIAFCFLDVPPANFVSGQGVGIPSTSNGLKVVFDTYNNCLTNSSTDVPKIELRWGTGYDECSSQPTIDNSNGELSFIRSDAYNHAIITYDAGNISVVVNDKLYLTGFQAFNFAGYLGFTSGTGGSFDNQSIKNVIIYTSVPSFDPGPDQSVCSGQTADIGTTDNPVYAYQWSPADGLSSSTISNPTVTIANATNANIARKYYITTTLSDGSGCTAFDSVAVTVKTLFPPLVSITSSVPRICGTDSAVIFTAVPTAGGASPEYQWFINTKISGSDSSTFTTNTLLNGDVVSCVLTNNESCAASNTTTSNPISLAIFPSPTVDAGSSVAINYGEASQLDAIITGDISSIAWSPAEGLSNSRISNPVAKPTATTLYTITVQTKDFCLASDTLTLKIISKDVVVPGAFTPDNNGDNDNFKPIILGAALDYLFVVYNRWGQRLFITATPGMGWDGSVNGQLQQPGTYTWTLSCTLNTKVHIQKQGTVVLIR